jgi:NADPH:quinone reductase-like Zn-dependent oxidoreductase
MKAAIVHSFTKPPSFGDFGDPYSQSDDVLVSVAAAALSPLVRGHASGRHYSSGSQLPFIPGVDGVGTLPDGSRVYFAFPKPPFGAMAERTIVANNLVVPVPDCVDDVTASAIANPGMSSWAALTERAKFVSGESVLINGATGSAGKLAIQIAKYLGAKRVIATGRNASRFELLRSLGADVVISLEQPDEDLARAFKDEIANGVDVILDYLWGKTAELLIGAAAGGSRGAVAPRLRYVDIGSISGPSINLPATALRSTGLEIMGSGLGSVSNGALVAAIGALLNAVIPANLAVETETVPLAGVESAWIRDTGDRRLVFTL